MNPRLRKAQKEKDNAEAELEAFQECYLRRFEELRDRQSALVDIDGVKYDRAVLKQAESFAQDGQISFAEARSLLDDAEDDGTKKQTIMYCMTKLTFTEKAAALVKARLEERRAKSYYKQVGGVKYDRELLEKAEMFAQISYAEAKELWDDAQDGKGLTEMEKETLQYTMKMFKYTEKAAAFMKSNLDDGKIKSYYKQIRGEKYDRELLEKAEQFAKDGHISFAEARALWEEAQDGKGVTDIEKKTLIYTVKSFHYTEKALSFMLHVTGGEESKSYYKHIDGVKYDRALLEMAERLSRDGGVSLTSAQQLLEEAKDGKGITEVEKQTLLYSMTVFTYADVASAFLTEKLA